MFCIGEEGAGKVEYGVACFPNPRSTTACVVMSFFRDKGCERKSTVILLDVGAELFCLC